MRISVDQDDPGYVRGIRAKVFLNGVEVNSCFTADEELGQVIIPGRDKSGLLIVDKEKDEILRIHLFGSVRIEVVN